MFILPNGAARKNFIREMTRLLNCWLENTPLKDIAMKAFHIMPAISRSNFSRNHRVNRKVKAALHSMRRMFESEEAETFILVDAANAFNSSNQKAMLHNIKMLCPILAQYVKNCHCSPARLFVIGGKEIKSNEGTTQGDPAGMSVYGIGLAHHFFKSYWKP